MKASYGNFKLSDAIRQLRRKVGGVTRGKPVKTRGISSEQSREIQENDEAVSGEASNRERMIEIGRGNQQAGRQGQ